MKTYTLPAQQIKAAQLAAGVNDVRYYINCVHVRSDRIMATNGHWAIKIMLTGDDQITGYDDIGTANDEAIGISVSGTIPSSAYKMVVLCGDDEDFGLAHFLDGAGRRLTDNKGRPKLVTVFFTELGKTVDIDKVMDVKAFKKRKSSQNNEINACTTYLEQASKALRIAATGSAKGYRSASIKAYDEKITVTDQYSNDNYAVVMEARV